MMNEHLKVAVRMRPLLEIDDSEESSIQLSCSSISISDRNRSITSEFDKIFGPSSSQSELFAFVSPSIESTLKGFNCTLFAYGQTGSGKTYTMFGSNWHDQDVNSGLIPKSLTKIFELSSSKPFSIYCSFLQIYNERLFDLLEDPNRNKSLLIRQNKQFGVFVEGLAEYVVTNLDECFALLDTGDRNRAVRQTRFNHHSSRSHTIFQLSVETAKANKKGNIKKSKVSFCDLAGSEKYDKENDMAIEHVKELTQINKSLSNLGKVIHALSTKSSHVPYRDSKLTRLLQDSLGGRTILIATISPGSRFIEETISTLKFADRAKEVMVIAQKNEVSAVNDEIIGKLQREIQHLKALLKVKSRGKGMEEMQMQLWKLQQENIMLKRTRMTLEDVEKLREENRRLKIELQGTESSQTEGICPHCKFPPPCVHYAYPLQKVPRSRSTSSSFQSERLGRAVELHKLSVRYKVKNNEESFASPQNDSRKEMRNIKFRLSKIAELEVQRKANFKKELEKLEENKREEEQKRKLSYDSVRTRSQKRVLSQEKYNHRRKANFYL